MKQNLYVIHDNKANHYDTPVPSHNDATIMRWFAQSIDAVPMMRMCPNDFSLYLVGTFDTETGFIDARESLLFVCSGLDCINIIQRENQAHEDTQVGDDSPVQSST